jgi:predicted nucleic acid-binding Zn ribbon protein
MKYHGKYLEKIRWQVQRERFQLDETYEPSPENTNLGIADTIKKILQRLEEKQSSVWLQLNNEWESLVGKIVASHARPGKIKDKMLIIYVDSSVWLNELLRTEQKHILSLLQKKFGSDEVKSIKLLTDPDR